MSLIGAGGCTGKPTEIEGTPPPLSGECGVIEEVSPHACMSPKWRHKELSTLQRQLESENDRKFDFFEQVAALESQQK